MQIKQQIWKGKEQDANIGGLSLPVSDQAYRLVWNDEFDGDWIDRTKWCADGSGCWNADYKYTNDKEHWNVSNSVATLTMTKFDEPDENGKLYLDALSLVTDDTMNFQYGYLEMRAKVPFFGKGEFPAFWLLSSKASLARQEKDFKVPSFRIEIGVFENFSSKNQLVPNLHKYENVPEKMRHSQLSGIDQGASKNGTRTFRFDEGVNPNDWHTYGMLWTENILSFSIDGDFYYTYDLSKPFGYDDNTDGFHQPVGIIISNQIFSAGWCKENEWAASLGPADDSIFPLKYSIDYVRLYQRENYGKLFVNDKNKSSDFTPKTDKRKY